MLIKRINIQVILRNVSLLRNMTLDKQILKLLQVSGKLVTTSCAVEGEIKVFEIRDLKLHCIFVSENVKDLSGHLLHMRHVRCLAVKGDNLFYGDDGVNLKVLAWKTGMIFNYLKLI